MYQSEYPQESLQPRAEPSAIAWARRHAALRAPSTTFLATSLLATSLPATPPATLVAIALGSNKPHGRYGRPAAILRAAVVALRNGGLPILALSPIITTPPVGPSERNFANAALTTEWSGSPMALLQLLKGIERAFGRQRGRRWGPRVLDLDILLIGNRRINAPQLAVPHCALAERNFVLQPLAAILPDWRHPKTGLSVRQMLARLNRPLALQP